MHGVILAPLGYEDEARLAAVSSVNPSEGLELRGNFLPDFWYWRENSRAFDEMAFHGWRSWTLQEPGHVEPVVIINSALADRAFPGEVPIFSRSSIISGSRTTLLSFS